MANTTLELKIRFGGALAGAPVATSDELRAALARSLGALCAEMGLAVEPVVALEPAAADGQAVQIRIGEQPVGFPAERWEAIHAETTDAAPVAALILEAVKLHPEHWLPDALVESIRAEARSDLPAPRLREILRAVLGQRVSLARREIVVRLLAEGASQGRSDVEIAESLIARLRPRALTLLFSTADRAPLASEEALRRMADGLYYELGLRAPDLAFEASPDLAAGAFALRINHLTTTPHPRGDDQSLPEICAQEIRRHAACLLDAEAVDAELARLDEAAPRLTAALAERCSLETLTAVLRGLLAEEVSIRDIRTIADRLLGYDEIPGDPFQFIIFDDRLVVDERLQNIAPDAWERLARLTQFVRAGLQRAIGFQYSHGSGALPAYLIAPDIEALLRGHLSASPLDPDERDAVLAAVRAEFLPPSPPSEAGGRPVALTASPIRLALRRLLADEFPSLAVLSYDELPADLNIQPLARISL